MAAICVNQRCQVQILMPTDAGVGNFERHCDFGCNAEQFCDILPIERACPGAPARPPSDGGCSRARRDQRSHLLPELGRLR